MPANSVTPYNPLQSFTIRANPVVNISWVVPSGAQETAFLVSGTWSQNVGTTFTSSDIVVIVDNRTPLINNFNYTASTRSFSFNIIPPTTGNGIIRISVPENSVTPYNSLQSVTVGYGSEPTVVWTAPVRHTGSSFRVSGIWNQNVTGLTADEIVVRGGTRSTPTINATTGAFSFFLSPTEPNTPNTCLLYTSPSPRD